LYPEPPAAGEVPACGEVGVLGVLPGIIGTYQATEAIKVITGIGEPLSGKLLMFNLLSNDIDILKFRLVEENQRITELSNYDELCGVAPASIDAVELNRWVEFDSVQIIDVREENEFEAYNIGGLNIPFDEVADNLNLLDKSKKIVVVCHTGLRAQKAIDLIKSEYPELTLFNLKGGIEASF
jgi:adenylyltransferase/sulfurtransferase